MKKIILFIVLTTFFSFLIFAVKNYIFGGFEEQIIKNIEEKYIEPTIEQKKTGSGIIKNQSSIDNDILKDKLEEHFDFTSKVSFIYLPKNFENKVTDYKELLLEFFNDEVINEKIEKLTVQMYKKKGEVRGKMKNKSIKFFGVLNIKKNEFLSVGIHEFGHYIDLYFLKKKVFRDLSDYFYEISWESTKILRPGQKQIDFVSGYSMTNKYEDFAESFAYYVLHNKDFLEKSKKSSNLKAKYEFFSKILFRNNEFKNSDFSENNVIKDYYRDITKIDYNLEKFLQYLEKSI